MTSCALLGLCALAANALAAPGDLDPSFGSGGRVVFELGDATVSPSDMLLQPDGKIVTLAATPSRLQQETRRDMLIARFNSDGSLDTSFNRIGYKLLAIDDTRERLDFLDRGQGWVVRKLREALPGIDDAELRDDLADMLETHERNIVRSQALR